MKRQKLDEFLRDKFDDQSITPPEYIWEGIERRLDQQLPQEKKKGKVFMTSTNVYRKIAITSVAASVMLAVGLWVVRNNESNTPLHIDNSSAMIDGSRLTTQLNDPLKTQAYPDGVAASNRSSLHPIYNNDIVIKPHNTPIVVDMKESDPVNYVADLDKVVHNVLDDLNKVNVINKLRKSDAYTYYGLQNTSEDVTIIDVSTEEKTVYNADTDLNIQSTKPTEVMVHVVDKPQNDFKPFENKDLITKSRSVVSLTAGYNYGTLDQGLAISLSSKKEINNKWYFEGNIGMVYNQAGQNQSMFAGDFLSFKKKVRNNQNVVATASMFENPNDYLFVQFNPIIGYQLNSKVNFGIGPDFQQLISNMGQDIIYFSGQGSGNLLPSRDWGVLGKVDYRISHRFKAGMMYRGGVSTYLHNNINIQNRNYFQLQLNYILNKN